MLWLCTFYLPFPPTKTNPSELKLDVLPTANYPPGLSLTCHLYRFLLGTSEKKNFPFALCYCQCARVYVFAGFARQGENGKVRNSIVYLSLIG